LKTRCPTPAHHEQQFGAYVGLVLAAEGTILRDGHPLSMAFSGQWALCLPGCHLSVASSRGSECRAPPERSRLDARGCSRPPPTSASAPKSEPRPFSPRLCYWRTGGRTGTSGCESTCPPSTLAKTRLTGAARRRRKPLVYPTPEGRERSAYKGKNITCQPMKGGKIPREAYMDGKYPWVSDVRAHCELTSSVAYAASGSKELSSCASILFCASQGDKYIDRTMYIHTQKEKKKGFGSGDFRRKDEFSNTIRTGQYRHQLDVSAYRSQAPRARADASAWPLPTDARQTFVCVCAAREEMLQSRAKALGTGRYPGDERGGGDGATEEDGNASKP
jgi:hypothetical protein